MTVYEAIETGGSESSGAELAFEVFFAEHQTRLYRTLALVTGSRDEAEEITQEAFVRVWADWERVAGMQNSAGYLYKIAINLHRGRRRAAVRAARHLVTQNRPSVESLDDRAGLVDALERLLVRLPPKQRIALVLTEYLDYDSARTAEILGVQPGTVRMLVSKARSRLRESGFPQ